VRSGLRGRLHASLLSHADTPMRVRAQACAHAHTHFYAGLLLHDTGTVVSLGRDYRRTRRAAGYPYQVSVPYW